MNKCTPCNPPKPCNYKLELIFTDQQPEGFQEWAQQVEIKECKWILPNDGPTGDIRIFVNNQNVLDNGAFTSFLVNAYNFLTA